MECYQIKSNYVGEISKNGVTVARYSTNVYVTAEADIEIIEAIKLAGSVVIAQIMNDILPAEEPK